MIGFEEYQDRTNATSDWRREPEKWTREAWLAYAALGMVGEAGETANKVKKIFRDDDGQITDSRRAAVLAEIGDTLWYAAQVCEVLGESLADVAQDNVDRLSDRLLRGAINGDGDQR